MNIVDGRREIVQFARRARGRQVFVRGLIGIQRALFWALLLALVALLVSRFFGLRLPWIHGVEALGVVVLVAALAQAFLPRLDLFQAACRADQQAGWKERLSSCLALPTAVQPMEQALVDDVRERLKSASASRLFPLRPARELKWVPVVAGAPAVAWFVLPVFDILGVEAKQKEAEKNKEELKAAVQKLEERKKKLEKDERPLDRVKDAIRKIEALANELHKDPPP